jgi:glycosyltransferase involved in cell wall biosynthesis
VDLVHTHGRSTFSLVALLDSLGLLRAPVVMHDHRSLEVDASVPLWFRVARRRLCHYVGVSERLRGWAEEAGVAPDRVSVIGNALNLDRVAFARPARVRDQLGIGPEVPVGLVVGGLRRDKGIDTLIDAVARSASRERARFLVAGADRDADYARACRLRAARLGLEASVVFLGERDDAPDLMRAADFAVIPSRSESGPLVLIEYLASGLPFVATRVGNVASQVAGAGLEAFVAPDDAGALAREIDRLLSLSPDARRERGRAGLEAALRSYDIRRRMPEWYGVYATAMRRRTE